MSPIMTITYDAGTESIRIDCEHLRLFNYSISFRLGEEFDEHTFSGETVRTLIEQETAYKLVQEQLTGKHKGSLPWYFLPFRLAYDCNSLPDRSRDSAGIGGPGSL